MIEFLKQLKNNPRGCLFVEPMWAIPFQLYAPFVALYMMHLGVLDVQIGIILAVSRVLQMIVAPFAGIVTDKLGRHKATLIFDLLAWSVPSLIWAFSQNFYWFIAAAVFNSFTQVTTVSWECLWLDEIEEAQIAPYFNWLYIAGLLAVFFAPLAGLFVGRYGVVAVVRVLYLVAFVSKTAMFVLRHNITTETAVGRERMLATKNTSVLAMLGEYRGVIGMIWRSAEMKRGLLMHTLMAILVMVSGTFFSLFATQSLYTPEAFLAYFPILRAGIMLVFIFFAQGVLARFSQARVMLVGIGLYILTFAWLIVAPPHATWWLVVFVMADAVASGLLFPRIEAMAAAAIDQTERARVRSIFNMFILGVSAPFGILVGFLSDIDRSWPFVLNMVLLAMMALLFVVKKPLQPQQV